MIHSIFWDMVASLFIIGLVIFFGFALKRHNAQKRQVKQNAIPNRVYDFFQY